MKSPDNGHQFLLKPQLAFGVPLLSLFHEDVINFHISMIRSVLYSPPYLVTKLTPEKNSSIHSFET